MERREDLEMQLKKVEHRQSLAEVVGGALVVGGLFAAFPVMGYIMEIAREYPPPIVVGMGTACCLGPVFAAVAGAFHYEEEGCKLRKQLDELDRK